MPPQPAVPAGSAVRVSIIDTTTRIANVATAQFMEPPLAGLEYLSSPSFSILVEHGEHGKVLFDLGVRKDWDAYAPHVSQRLSSLGWEVSVRKDTAEILAEHGTRLEEVKAIVWSHWHWDHIGDPSTFPSTTDLIVGPGFKEAFMPGYPLNSESPIQESDYHGRNLIELDFNTVDLTIYGFKAIDYFHDGSFYLLDAPGHAIGHLCALARTSFSPDTFILMGGDACHHSGELRPSELLPLPSSVPLNPSSFPLSSAPASHQPPLCPGALLEDLQHRRGLEAIEPFFRPVGSADPVEAVHTIRKVQRADAEENVLVIIAHDAYLKGVVDFFPERANGWSGLGWGEQVRWAFVRDFKICGVEE